MQYARALPTKQYSNTIIGSSVQKSWASRWMTWVHFQTQIFQVATKRARWEHLQSQLLQKTCIKTALWHNDFLTKKLCSTIFTLAWKHMRREGFNPQFEVKEVELSFMSIMLCWVYLIQRRLCIILKHSNKLRAQGDYAVFHLNQSIIQSFIHSINKYIAEVSLQ